MPAGRTAIKSGIDEMAGLLTGNPEHFAGRT
jgi:hypothetical protein